MKHIFNPKSIGSAPYVAVSGGVDSIALLDFCIKQYNNVTAIHYIHNHSAHAEKEAEFVANHCSALGVPLIVGIQNTPKPPPVSLEAYWRTGRMEFFSSFESTNTILTGHNLDDAVEWYLFTCLTGEGHHMPFRYKNVIRPLLLTPKSALVKYAIDNDLIWLDDPTNLDLHRPRNRIRHDIVPSALIVNPGLYTVVKKRLKEKYSEKRGKHESNTGTTV